LLSLVRQRQSTCARLSRRGFLEAAGAGLLGLTLPRLLAAEAARGEAAGARAKSVIFLFLFGGPSQLETFDLKPEAPSEIRGPFRPIPSRTPGLLISEGLPRLARLSDRYCVIRTMTHGYNDHSGAAHYIQTGKSWQVPVGGGFDATPRDWPSLGSVVEYLDRRGPEAARPDLPSYVVLPNHLGGLQEGGQYRRPGEYAGWLGRVHNPLTTAIGKRGALDNPYWRDCTDDELHFQIEGMSSPVELSLDRVRGRMSLLEQLEARHRALDRHGAPADFDRFRRRALGIIASDATRRALDIREEPDRVRDRFGRHLFGQSVLMARRLIEAGARFVTVHYDSCDGYSWDSHQHSNDVRDHLLPTFDQALAGLLEDLEARGLLEETLVVALGEMGRTPVPANRQWGRGHWSTLFPAVVAGGGVRGGIAHGRSDKDAAYPKEHPVSPEDLAATIYHALGIDPEMLVDDPDGRPVPLVDGGRPLRELFG
jgi:hypothetical protein